jgi:molybdopterin/thiamine biosynthesis adenylyltransferase
VHPGILVRQPYDDSQIGDAKAAVLVDRLRRIHPDAAVEAVCEDVVTAFFDPASPPLEFDLVIDATADRRVRTWIERQWSPHRAERPVLATVLIGHEASRGIATVSYPEASGAAVDILRRLNLAVREDTTGDFAGVVEDFFPDPPRTQMFQPEPGCSDVTFVAECGLSSTPMCWFRRSTLVGARDVSSRASSLVITR